jgi:hypothetical protein
MITASSYPQRGAIGNELEYNDWIIQCFGNVTLRIQFTTSNHMYEEQDLSRDDLGAVSNPDFYMDDVGGFNDGKNVS